MDTRDLGLSLVMVASAFALTYSHLMAFSSLDPVQIVSAVLLIAAMAAMMASTSSKLSRLEQELKASQRAMRIGIQGVEEKIEKSSSKCMAVVEDISRKIYR